MDLFMDIMKYNNKILVVDDSIEWTRLIIESIIDDKNSDILDSILFAKNCEEALDLFVKHHPIITFLDIKLPGKSGTEIAMMIRKLDSGARIFFLSNYPGDHDAMKLIENHTVQGIFGKDEGNKVVAGILNLIIKLGVKFI